MVRKTRIPLYASHLDPAAPPVAGWLDGFVWLEGSPAVCVRDLTTATKGIAAATKAGPQYALPPTNASLVDVPKGGRIIVRLDGNLQRSRALFLAIDDTQHDYFAIFRIIGRLPNGLGPQYEVLLAKHEPLRAARRNAGLTDNGTGWRP